MPEAQHRRRTIAGLDSIRFFCALWVYFSHFGFAPLPERVTSTAWGHVFAGVYHNMFCGVAAVIAFFVISGFCIHYPHVHTRELPLLSYYVRRYVRIAPPLLVAVALGRFVGQGMQSFYDAILWSLVAEAVYYFIYPLLRIGLQRWPRTLIGVSYLGCFAVMLTQPRALNYHQFGPYLTWIVGLPVWLLGCQLAVAVARGSVGRKDRAPWAWRLGVWGYSIIASIVRFHGGIGYPWTLIVMGLLVYFWLRSEFAYYFSHSPVAALEAMGKWTYSIYLVHGLVVYALIAIPAFPTLSALRWVLETVAVLACSAIFYYTVEMPSHRAAYWLARRAKQTPQRLEASLAAETTS